MKRRSIMALSSMSLVAAVVVTTWSSAARAEVVLGGDFNIAAPVGNDTGSKIGFGFDGRFGYRLSLGPVFIQPEAQFGYLTFSTDLDTSVNLWNISGGGRVGLGGIVQPNAFVHFGYGHSSVASSGPGESLGDGGFLFDIGGAVDFKLVPFLSFGAEVGFTDTTVTGSSFKLVHFGPEVAVSF